MPSTKKILGIDPGLHGAVALVTLTDPPTVQVWDTPTVSVKRGKRTVLELNEEAFATIIDKVSRKADEAWIEKVASMKDQGIASSFAFGQVYGAMRMSLSFARIPYALVTPSRWKMAMGCGANKDSSLAVCLKLFGDEHRSLWFGSRMGTLDGRCEAALIAMYGSNHNVA